jgi:hypothetical protein
MLFALIALVAIEIATLKNPLEIGVAVLEFLLRGCILAATWGAFCLHGKSKRFSLGFAVIFWAYFFYSFFTTQGRSSIGSQYFMNIAYEFFGHKQVEYPTLAFEGGEFPGDVNLFVMLWKLWSYINFSLLGGILALCFSAVVPQGACSATNEKKTSGSSST